MLAVFAFVPFGQHQTEHDAVFERMRIRDLFLVKEHRADGQLAVEPSASLVQRFTNEVRRKLAFEGFGILMRVSPLREGHGAAVVPTIDDLGDATHASPGRKR